MLKLVLEEKPEYCVSDYEIVNKRKTSYTVNTLRALQAAYPERRFKLIMGMDNFREFDSWHRWQEILSLAAIVVAARPSSALPSGQALDILQQRRIALDALSAPGQIAELATTPLDISSSHIRQLLGSGQAPDFLLPPAVVEYIRQQQLYQSSSENRGKLN